MDDRELRSICVPTLFLVGENEKIYPARNAIERLSQVAPGIKTELLSGVGHDILRLRPKQVAEKVQEFLG